MKFAHMLAGLGLVSTGVVGSALVLGSSAAAAPAKRVRSPVLSAAAAAAASQPIATRSTASMPSVAGILGGSGPTSVLTNTGPRIHVTSPARGSFTTTGVTLVQGSVADVSTISVFTIQGNPVTLAADGSFSEPVSLSTGLNVIDLEAWDTQGVGNKASLAVLYGEFRPEGQSISNGLAVRLNQGSFDAVSQVISSKISGDQLENALLARNPLAHASGWWGHSTVNCTSACIGNPTVTLTPEPGDIRVHVEVPGIRVNLQELGSWNIPDLSGYVSTDPAVLDAQISVTVANGVVTTSVVNDSCDLRNFNWGINGLPGFITDLFKGLVRDKVQTEIANMVKSVLPPEVNKMIAGATGQPFTQPILGSTATFSVAPSSISVDANGLNAVVDADCSLAPLAGYSPLPAPGSLVTHGALPQNGGPGPDLFASVNEDLLNRAGYAVWKSGVAQIRIDDSPTSVFHMPVGYPLDMGLLLTFLPELQGVANPADQLALCVTPLLPPVFRATGNPNTLVANMGEVEIEFVDTVTGHSVITLVANIRCPAKLTLNAQNTFDVTMSDRPVVDVSLVSSLATDINIIGIDNVMSLFAPTVVQIAGNQWSGFPLPTYPGLVPAACSIYQDGTDGTFVTAAADFECNGPALPTHGSYVNPIAKIIASVGAINPAIFSTIASAPVTGTGTSSATAPGTLTATTGRTTATRLAGSLSAVNIAALRAAAGIVSTPTPAVNVPGETITASTGYVALVADGLETAVAPLLNGYESRGVSVACVPLSHVVAQGRDRAEQIRNWLVAHCDDGHQRYLLLVGGPTAIPFRTCQPSKAVTTVVSDLYYGDLRGNWDANGNGTYGELADQVNFDAEMYVGRLPFDDAQSVTTAVNAIEAARNPANKGAWSNRALLVGATTIQPGDDPIGESTCKALAFDPEGWDSTTAFAPESFLHGDMTLGSSTIVDQLNANPAALLFTMSHGSTTGLFSHPDASTWNDVLTIPQLAQLPKDKPPVEVAIACNTADPTNGPCIGSIALQNGVAGWVGCTVVTDPRSGGGAWLLATVQLAKELAAGKSLGQSLGDTVRDFVATGRIATIHNDDAEADLEQQGMSWVIYGDPGLCLGPKAP